VNGVHDLGGQHGHGPVVAEPNEPVFHERWEGRVYGLMRLARRCGLFNVDEMRRAIESMPPAEYLRAGYYERWLFALEQLLDEKGVGRERTPAREAEPVPPERPRVEARFKIGDPVRTRLINPADHTRLPRYARGKAGTVEAVHGPYALPDLRAHGKGVAWQPVYNVRFSAPELWGEDGHGNDSVSLDLWEEYLQ
jgi:nitrile hydratase